MNVGTIIIAQQWGQELSYVVSRMKIILGGGIVTISYESSY